MKLKNKAIAVYLDNNDKNDIELSWLYKTWIFNSLNDDFDLVVYYNPDAKHRLEKFLGVRSVPMAPIRKSSDYPFLNSHYFCLEPYNSTLKEYDYIMKTDCDVFLTKNLKGYVPSEKMLVGHGGYYSAVNNDLVLDWMKDDLIPSLNKKMNYRWEHRNIILVGASFFGKAKWVINTVNDQAILTEEILEHFGDRKIIGPSISRGISSMLAGEIVINTRYTNQQLLLWALDSVCWEDKEISSDVLHIHAWHTDRKWSKHSFFNGDYNNWIVDDKDIMSNRANYCQWIASSSIEDIIRKK